MSEESRTTPGPSLEKFEFDLQGHRGCRGLRPENTLPAFEEALRLGVTTLELDVVISRDEHVVVSHDPWFNPVLTTLPDGSPMPEEAALDYKLFEMDYDEISRFDVGLRPHPLFPRQKKMPAVKPRLDEVIAFAESYQAACTSSKVRYNIETKSTVEGDHILHPIPERFVDLLLVVITESGIATRTTIQSFDVRTLRVVNERQSACLTSLLIDEQSGNEIDEQIAELGFRPDIYSPHYRLVSQSLIERARQLDIQVLPWTVNDAGEMKSLLAMGVDGFITDYPDMGKQFLS